MEFVMKTFFDEFRTCDYCNFPIVFPESQKAFVTVKQTVFKYYWREEESVHNDQVILYEGHPVRPSHLGVDDSGRLTHFQ